ncbi:hypothetical protein VTJ83DRAFT_3636 [Remersonia thermophila]|uniref:Carbohydrate-binding module family 19 domain-containing protein n=1 Tax=Remersonia thermophila TaxID=72144 RepID=A0ABR4DEK6_9PEZI
MKYIAAIVALATSALALPSGEVDKRSQCTFGTYRCTNPNTGIEICDVSGNWVLVGPCPNGTTCSYLPQNGFDLPFCTNSPPPTPTSTTDCEEPTTTLLTKRAAATNEPRAAEVEPRNGRPGLSPGEPCSTPGQYDCFGAYAIMVCDVTKIERFVGHCPERSHCEYLNGLPYCVANY